MNEAALEKTKAPCRFVTKNAAGHLVYTCPAVDCGMDCRNCSWNPAEKKRRFEQGRFVETDGVKTLRFPPKEEKTALQEAVENYLREHDMIEAEKRRKQGGKE